MLEFYCVISPIILTYLIILWVVLECRRLYWRLVLHHLTSNQEIAQTREGRARIRRAKDRLRGFPLRNRVARKARDEEVVYDPLFPTKVVRGESAVIATLRRQLEFYQKEAQYLEKEVKILRAEPEELRRKLESAERKAAIAKHKLKILRENFRFHYDYQMGLN